MKKAKKEAQAEKKARKKAKAAKKAHAKKENAKRRGQAGGSSDAEWDRKKSQENKQPKADYLHV